MSMVNNGNVRMLRKWCESDQGVDSMTKPMVEDVLISLSTTMTRLHQVALTSRAHELHCQVYRWGSVVRECSCWLSPYMEMAVECYGE